MATMQKTARVGLDRDPFFDLSERCRKAPASDTARLIVEAHDLLVSKELGREAIWEIARRDLQVALRTGFVEGAAISLLPGGAVWTGGSLQDTTTISMVRLPSGISAACRDAANFALALVAALCRCKSQEAQEGRV